MAELTLERIAELRADMKLLDDDIAEFGGTFAMVTIDSRKLKQLLDAAERGLSNDRKAAAFDRLAAINELDIQTFGDTKFVYDYSGESSNGPTLLDAVEALPQTNGEPKP